MKKIKQRFNNDENTTYNTVISSTYFAETTPEEIQETVFNTRGKSTKYEIAGIIKLIKIIADTIASSLAIFTNGAIERTVSADVL